jgi:DNA-binding response OmpR family regulator
LKLKLTEKEISIILYLFKKKTPISIKELKKNVWQYHSGIETHTVETHIYRLRKKIDKTFNDKNFILSKKDGYQIK